jgi:glycosyltransferase involved in cell wall biosynthesis
MSEPENNPLLTFALIAYNQERFIREAVEGAFAQTYSPLEIILSDDCSSDRTFEMMSEMAAAYQGPHRIVLNRNAVRSGLGGHVNRVMELQHGELVVIAAGDDVSLPERTQVLYDAWKSDGKQATTVHSRFMRISEVGASLDTPTISKPAGLPLPIVVQSTVPVEFLRSLHLNVTGCANAWSPRLFAIFRPLPSNIIHEDEAITFRSVLTGRILRVDVPLVKYRQHDDNLYNKSGIQSASIGSMREQEMRLRTKFERRAVMHAAFLSDLETARELKLLSDEDYRHSRSEAQRLREAFELQARYLNSGFWMKTYILGRLFRLKAICTEWPRLIHRWMPTSLVLITRLGLSKLRAPAAFLKPNRPTAKAETS